MVQAARKLDPTPMDASLEASIDPASERFASLIPYDREANREVLRTICVYGRKAYAHPSRETAAFIAANSDKLVEAGAGSGLTSKTLRNCAIDIIATDPLLTSAEDGTCAYRFVHGSELPVLAMGGKEAVEAHPDRDLLIVMPHPNDLWVAEALLALSPGRKAFLHMDGSIAKPGERFPGLVAMSRVIKEHFDYVDKAPLFTIGSGDGYDALQLFIRR